MLADINLNAKVAGLVMINAGVQVSIAKVNLTNVDAQLELIVRLGEYSLVHIYGQGHVD